MRRICMAIVPILLLLTGCSEPSLQEKIQGKKWKLLDSRQSDRYAVFTGSHMLACLGNGWASLGEYSFVGNDIKLYPGGFREVVFSDIAVSVKGTETLFSYVANSSRSTKPEGEVFVYMLSDSDDCYFDENTEVKI